mmetsp:Transcript_61449/g.174552  ORF Transcript_61449/g.174552 Transcript_61449/m.174552 type:complete len:439 (+) Transcript_61449:211-1527(+)
MEPGEVKHAAPCSCEPMMPWSLRPRGHSMSSSSYRSAAWTRPSSSSDVLAPMSWKRAAGVSPLLPKLPTSRCILGQQMTNKKSSMTAAHTLSTVRYPIGHGELPGVSQRPVMELFTKPSGQSPFVDDFRLELPSTGSESMGFHSSTGGAPWPSWSSSSSIKRTTGSDGGGGRGGGGGKREDGGGAGAGVFALAAEDVPRLLSMRISPVPPPPPPLPPLPEASGRGSPRPGGSAGGSGGVLLLPPSGLMPPTSPLLELDAELEPSARTSPLPSAAGGGGAGSAPPPAAGSAEDAPPLQGLPGDTSTMVYVGGLKRKGRFVELDLSGPIFNLGDVMDARICELQPMTHSRCPSAAEACTVAVFLLEAKRPSIALSEPPVTACTPPREMVRTTSSMLPMGGSEKRSVRTRSVPFGMGTEGCGWTDKTVGATPWGTTRNSNE